MNKKSLIGKYFTFGIILLFIGISLAPSINFNIIKASNDNDFIEVITQTCGIKGFGDTTVKLTREQYVEVEMLFDYIETKLQTAKTQEEALPIHSFALRELDRYGLLPRGMSVEHAQKLVTDSYKNLYEKSGIEKLLYKNIFQPQDHYILSFVIGVVHDGYTMGLLYMIGIILMLLSIFPSPFPFLPGNPLVFLLGVLLYGIGNFVNFFPLAIMQQVHILSGNMTLVGLDGSLQFNEGLLNGFTGIKITRIDTKEMYLLGFSLIVSYPE